MRTDATLARTLARAARAAALLAAAGCSGTSDTPAAESQPCSVSGDGSGTYTMTCPDGSSVSWRDGEAGAPGQAGEAGEAGAPGAAGAEGAAGAAGDAGPAGGPGPEGDPGEPGASALLALDAVPAGDDCAAGGTRVRAGLDSDGDGSLDEEEVSSTAFVCHGEQGPAGDRGSPGEAGPPGDPGHDGEPGTPGAPGEQGDPGVPGAPGELGEDGRTALIAIDEEPPGFRCPDGGLRIRAGVDSDGDGELDDDEVTDTARICQTDLGPDGDVDRDGVPNGADNCVYQANDGQTDLDLDGLGDDCDPDADGDGFGIAEDCGPDDATRFPGAEERCNGVDDNCDGADDEEHPDVGQACTVGLGECEREGVRVCTEDGQGTECAGEAGEPAEEVLDELDNDCDGSVDEDLCGNGVPEEGEECDDGNDVDGDECTNGCTDARCGDGIVGPGEACDDPDDPDCPAGCGAWGPGSAGALDLADGWAVRCTEWVGNECRGPQVQLPAGECLPEGWWNLNYWHGPDRDNACNLFCQLTVGANFSGCASNSPAGGPNPGRRLVDVGETGCVLGYPTGAQLTQQDGWDGQNLSVTCPW